MPGPRLVDQAGGDTHTAAAPSAVNQAGAPVAGDRDGGFADQVETHDGSGGDTGGVQST